MTRRKAKDTELWGVFRKADVEAEYKRRLERVIEACAEAAQDQLPFVAVNARRHMRRAVTAAGRRAAKGET